MGECGREGLLGCFAVIQCQSDLATDATAINGVLHDREAFFVKCVRRYLYHIGNCRE